LSRRLRRANGGEKPRRSTTNNSNRFICTHSRPKENRDADYNLPRGLTSRGCNHRYTQMDTDIKFPPEKGGRGVACMLSC
jgi:hypothetical protein